MLKTTLISGLLIGATLTGVATANEPSPDREACKAEMEARKAQIDTNGDGTISDEERRAHLTERFYAMSGDDILTGEEIKAYREANAGKSDCAKKPKKKKDISEVSMTLDEFIEKSESRMQKRKARGQERKKQRESE